MTDNGAAPSIDLSQLEKQDAELALNLAMLDSSELEKKDSQLALQFAMLDTNTGKAWNFASKVLAFQQDMLKSQDPDMNANNFKTVNQDDMVFLAERVLEKQEEFRQDGKPFHVDIGYHYTHSNHMHRVKTNGLLSNAERQERNIQVNFNGATFGDGIYTCSNPYAYHEFAGGDVCLFVARLTGNTEVHSPGMESNPTIDTFLGRAGDTDEVIVLRSSAQCISLVQFGSPMITLYHDASVGNEMVYKYHFYLQEIVDECFNGGETTPVPQVFPSQVLLRTWGNALPAAASLPPAATASRTTIPTERIEYKAPDCLRQGEILSRMLEIPPLSASPAGECTICLEKLQEDQAAIVRLVDCKHEFHGSCIETALSHSKKCPTCRKPVGKPQGAMPSGILLIDWRDDLVCNGFGPGAIVLTYQIESGRQKKYHQNPGMPHAGTNRVAYLPMNREGEDLLKRLKFAFICGLTFTVGTSLTTGKPNSVTWSSIHHKTSLTGGVHGYPDAGYFINANEELDALYMPSADDL